MCRWIAYVGSPVPMEALITRPGHSLIDQSLASREGAETTNGDGFGVGWYGTMPEPGVYKSTEPAWNDRNLAELSRHIKSHLFLAHVRATTGTPRNRIPATVPTLSADDATDAQNPGTSLLPGPGLAERRGAWHSLRRHAA